MSQNVDNADLAGENKRLKALNAELKRKLQPYDQQVKEITELNDQQVKEITELKAVIAELKRKFSFYSLVDRFYGRTFALLVGLIAVWFLCVPVSNILSTDLRTLIVETSKAKAIVVDSPTQKAYSSTNSTGSSGSMQGAKTNSSEMPTAYVALTWSCGIKVFGSIIVFCVLLWALLALVRSDQRD